MVTNWMLLNIYTLERKPVRLVDLAKWLGKDSRNIHPTKIGKRYVEALHSYIVKKDMGVSELKGLINKHGDLKGERWESFKGGWLISNYGRYRDARGCKIALPDLTSHSHRIRIRVEGEMICVQTHNAVYETFVGAIKKGNKIYHKDGNFANCHADNLIQDRAGLLCKYYMKSYGNSVVSVNCLTGDVDFFDTILECARVLYVGRDTVSDGLDDNKVHCGYKFYNEATYERMIENEIYDNEH